MDVLKEGGLAKLDKGCVGVAIRQQRTSIMGAKSDEENGSALIDEIESGESGRSSHGVGGHRPPLQTEAVGPRANVPALIA